MFGTFSTDDARVNEPLFKKKSHFVWQYDIFHRDAIHFYFCLWKCFWLPWLKTNTLQMIRFNQTPLFNYPIAWWQTLLAAKSLKFSFLHAVYIGSSHCSVRLIICDGIEIFSDYVKRLNVTFLRGSSNKFWQWPHISETAIEIRILLPTACGHGCCLLIFKIWSFYHNLIQCYKNL